MKFVVAFLLLVAFAAAEDTRADRVLFFHGAWCIPCHEALDGPTGFRKWLTDAGWQINDSPASHIQLVDVERRADLVERYGVVGIPSMVRLRNGKAGPPVKYTGRQSLLPLLDVAKSPIVQFAKADHWHQCPVDGTVWGHTHRSYGSPIDHACPSCGRIQWRVLGR